MFTSHDIGVTFVSAFKSYVRFERRISSTDFLQCIAEIDRPNNCYNRRACVVGMAHDIAKLFLRLQAFSPVYSASCFLAFYTNTHSHTSTCARTCGIRQPSSLIAVFHVSMLEQICMLQHRVEAYTQRERVSQSNRLMCMSHGSINSATHDDGHEECRNQETERCDSCRTVAFWIYSSTVIYDKHGSGVVRVFSLSAD